MSCLSRTTRFPFRAAGIVILAALLAYLMIWSRSVVFRRDERMARLSSLGSLVIHYANAHSGRIPTNGLYPNDWVSCLKSWASNDERYGAVGFAERWKFISGGSDANIRRMYAINARLASKRLDDVADPNRTWLIRERRSGSNGRWHCSVAGSCTLDPRYGKRGARSR